MRKIHYLILMLSMVSVAAFAQEWERPVPATVEFQASKVMYLYNVGRGMFFTQGNEYGTQGSVADQGYQVSFTQFVDENGEWDGKSYVFNDSIESGDLQGWHEVYMEEWNEHIYVDHRDQENYFWELEALGGNTYRLYPGDRNPALNHAKHPGTYTGVDVSTNPTSTAVEAFLEVGAEDVQEGDYLVEWQFVTIEAYEAFQTQLELYYAAEALGDAIIAAENEGLDVAAQKAVYANHESTVAQLTAARESITELYKQQLQKVYTPTHPLDMDADYVVNTTFDDNIDGWATTTDNAANYPNADENVDGVNFTYKFWLNWNGSPMTGKMYKTLTGMPEGVYHLRMAAYSEKGEQAYVYIFNDSTELTTPKPNFYEVSTFVYGTDTFEIGLNCPVANSTWIGIDNVHLEYYGNNAESYGYIANYHLENAPDYSSVKCYKPLLEEYETAKKALSSVSDYETAVSVIGTFKTVQNSIAASVAAYDAYGQLLDKAYDVLDKKYGPDLEDYVLEASNHYMECDLTQEEITAALTEFADLIEATEKAVYDEDKYTPTHPLDMDDVYVVNTTFDETYDGWLSTTHCDYGGLDDDAERVDGEIFSGKFWLNWKGNPMTGKMYKEVTGIPEGVYHLRLSAYSEAGENAYVYAFQDSTELVTPDPHVYDVYTFVYGTDKFEIGLSCPVANSTWIGIDNAHLEYYGRNAESFEFIAQYYADNAPEFTEEDCSAELLQEYNDVVKSLPDVSDYKSAVAIIGRYKELLKEIAASGEEEEPEPQPQWEGYPASMICVDPSWGPSVYVDANRASNADVTGYGTYNVTETINGGLNGVTVFCIDIVGAGEKYNAENTVATVDKLTVDDVDITVDNTKILYGDLEGNGNFRIEIYNDYGAGTNSNPPIDQTAMIGSVVSVTFTLAQPTGVRSADGVIDATATFYSISGVKLLQPQHGVNVMRVQLPDGSIKTSKVFIQ